MTRFLAFFLAVGLLGVSGAIAGLWTNRWGTSQTVQQITARLQEVPLNVDGWDATETTIDERALQVGEITGYLSRKYVHRLTGVKVTLTVVGGRAGPICVHTPEVCYGNSGYEQTGTSRYKVPAPTGAEASPQLPAEFSVLEFRKQNVATPSQMRLFLAWGTKAGWAAPAQPRITFAREPALFKIYVIREVPKLQETPENDPATDLIKVFLPKLNEKLFPQA